MSVNANATAARDGWPCYHRNPKVATQLYPPFGGTARVRSARSV